MSEKAKKIALKACVLHVLMSGPEASCFPTPGGWGCWQGGGVCHTLTQSRARLAAAYDPLMGLFEKQDWCVSKALIKWVTPLIKGTDCRAVFISLLIETRTQWPWIKNNLSQTHWTWIRREILAFIPREAKACRYCCCLSLANELLPGSFPLMPDSYTAHPLTAYGTRISLQQWLSAVLRFRAVLGQSRGFAF